MLKWRELFKASDLQKFPAIKIIVLRGSKKNVHCVGHNILLKLSKVIAGSSKKGSFRGAKKWVKTRVESRKEKLLVKRGFSKGARIVCKKHSDEWSSKLF